MISGRLLSALDHLSSYNTSRNPEGARHMCMVREI